MSHEIKKPEIIAKYDYIPWDKQSESLSESLKSQFHVIELMLNNLRPGRELSLVRTNLEQTFMWIGKAIRQDQIERQKMLEQDAQEKT